MGTEHASGDDLFELYRDLKQIVQRQPDEVRDQVRRMVSELDTAVSGERWTDVSRLAGTLSYLAHVLDGAGSELS